MSVVLRESYERYRQVCIKESMNKYQEQSVENLSSHKFSYFRDGSPAKYKAVIDGVIPQQDVQAFIQGRGAHTLILEGRNKYLSEYVVGGPVNQKTGKAFGRETKTFKHWLIEERVDINRLLTIEEDKLNEVLAKSARNNPIVVDILSDGIAESVIRTEYLGVNCQVRPDWISPHYGIIDLKTCAELARFERDARYKFNYIANAAFYRSVIGASLGSDYLDLPFLFIAIEKNAPYSAGVFEVDPALLDMYEQVNEKSIERLKECRANNKWPNNFEGITTITNAV